MIEQFVDVVSFTAEAGNGGAGSTSFRKEAHVPMGGPDGGNGGNGGNVIIKVDSTLNSFGRIKSRKKFRAKDGEPGTARLSDGKSGEDLIIRVPLGTVIYNVSEYEDEEDIILADLTKKNDVFVLVHGGKGGKGNKFYATATNQAPDYAQHGLKGESLNVRLEVKIIADVGLVGFPNAGKSSFLSRLTRANPKIASYPFTTLTPNLGICYLDIERNFVIADIPGIIEGAHKGSGLGFTFLRHIERTSILAFIIDISSEEPFEDYKKLLKELKLYSKKLTEKKSIIVLNKIDMLEEKEVENSVRNFKKLVDSSKKIKSNILDIFAVSVLSSSDEELKPLAEELYKANENINAGKEEKKEEKQVSIIKTNISKKYVFGPVKSKRLGNSLGIDVTPYKTCSYNCIYCQLGKEENTTTELSSFADVDEVIFQLKEALHNYKDIDFITFTGTGEPTLYKDLKKLIYEIKQITNMPVCVITNGSLLYKQEIRSNILLADVVIPSLDSGNYETFKIINQPNKDIDFYKMVDGLVEFKRVFKGEVWLEIFLLDEINDSEEEIKEISKLVDKINPDKVQLITATRHCAYKEAKSVSIKKLEGLKKYFNKPVEIPKGKNDNTEKNKSITESDVLEAIIRQPDTAELIAAGFNADLKIVQKFLDSLVKKRKLKTEKINGKKNYFLNTEK